jgi:MFS family permease
MAFFSKKWVMLACLILVTSLHGLVFATAQDVERFVSASIVTFFKSNKQWFTLTLYFGATVVALLNQWFSRLWGIKRVLIGGLASNFLGLAFFYLCNLFEAGTWMSYSMIIFGLFLLGAAISSVATVLATYVVVEFPKIIALGLILLYSFLDLGIMLAPSLFQYFTKLNVLGWYLLALTIVMFVLMIILQKYLVVPEIPRHLDEMRQGSFLWKRLRSRLGLFVLCMIFYGMLEYTFNIMGHFFLRETISVQAANQAVFCFWMALTLGQIAIGLPAFWVRPANVMKILPLFIVLALVLMPFQSDLSSFLLVFIIGGIGCSAVFPLLIAMIQIDLSHTDHHEHNITMVPYIEAACGYMVASYSFGNGLIALESDFISKVSSVIPLFVFKVGIGLALALWLFVFYLDKTSPQKAT